MSEPITGRTSSAVICADGATHYGASQTERFSEKRLLAQADFAGCGPHKIAPARVPSSTGEKDR